MTAIDEARRYMESAIDALDSHEWENDDLDATTAVMDALSEGLRMIEFKYGSSSREAGEVRSFIKALEDL